jgi:hypothetical protein
MRDARVVLIAAIGLLAIAIAAVLSGSPPTLTRTNGIEPFGAPLAAVPGGGGACQAGELLPAHTSAIRLSLEASAGPRVAVRVLSGGAVVARGESASGWLAKVVTIPVAPLDHAVRDATVCFSFRGAYEQVSFLGVHTSGLSAARSGADVLPGRIAIEYLRPGSTAWWSLASSVARRMGLGRAWAGTWIVLLVGSLMVASIALASWLTIRESR